MDRKRKKTTNKKKSISKKNFFIALIPFLGMLLFVFVLADGIKKQSLQISENPVQGIHADSSLKGYLGKGFAYAGSNEDKEGNEDPSQPIEEQAQVLPEEEPEPTVLPEPTAVPKKDREEVLPTVTPTPALEPQITEPEKQPETNNDQEQETEESNTIQYEDPDDSENPNPDSDSSGQDDDRNQNGATVPEEPSETITPLPEEPQITEPPAPTQEPPQTDPEEENYPVIATDLTDGETVNASYRTFYVQATDHYGNSLGAVSVEVAGNGQKLSFQGEPAAGILAYRLELVEGANTIDIKATDEEGWTTTLPTFTIYKGEEEAPETAGSITISIEAGTVGLGTILPATSISFYQGEQLSSVLLRLLQDTGFDWRNDGNVTGGFYLKAIGRGGISAGAAIPEDLLAHLKEVNCQLSDHDANWLGEFDFTMDSGWLYSVNGEYMNVGMSAYFPADGDEVRLRFSLYSGADVGGGTGGETWGDW